MGCDLPAEPQMEFVRKALGFFGGWTDKLSIFFSYRKPQAMLVEEKSRSVETVEKEPPFAIIRSG